jgi:hypothetical protein
MLFSVEPSTGSDSCRKGGLVPFPARRGKGCVRSILLLSAALLVAGAWGAGTVFSRLSKAESAAEASFRWPYFLYTPAWLEDNRVFGKPIRYPGVGHTMTLKEFLDLRDFFTMVLAEEGA